MGTYRESDKNCVWCGESMEYFQNASFNGKFINCTCCKNQYKVEYDSYLSCYLIKTAVNGMLVRDIEQERHRAERGKVVEVACIENRYGNSNFDIGEKYVINGNQIDTNFVKLNLDSSCIASDEFEFACCKFKVMM